MFQFKTLTQLWIMVPADTATGANNKGNKTKVYAERAIVSVEALVQVEKKETDDCVGDMHSKGTEADRHCNSGLVCRDNLCIRFPPE